MTKLEFFAQLRRGLSGLPQEDIEQRVNFYSEMIDDRMEDGLTEEEAVAAMGPVAEITNQAIAEIPLSKIATNTLKPKRRLSAWEIVLIVLGFPIWFSLGIAAFAVVLSVYISAWSVIISLWAVFGAFVACSFAGILAGIILACNGNMLPGIATIGAGITCTGLSIFTLYGCKYTTMGIVGLTKKFTLLVKSCFIKKEVA